jgi:hypothetical protein
MPTAIEVKQPTEKQPTEVEILTSQLQIAEASIIELKAGKAALVTENTELKKLINENIQAQQILSTAAAAISSNINEKEHTLLEIPEGLSSKEMQVLKDARQAEINALVAKQDEYKKYIRGEI